MSRFKRFRYGPQERRQFWEEHKPRIRALLEEINEEVFDGRLDIRDGGAYLFSSSLGLGLHRRSSITETCILSVCASRKPGLFRVANHIGSYTGESVVVGPDGLEDALKEVLPDAVDTVDVLGF